MIADHQSKADKDLLPSFLIYERTGVTDHHRQQGRWHELIAGFFRFYAFVFTRSFLLLCFYSFFF